MTERKESVLEAVELTSVKNEVFTQEICVEDEELGLQALPLVYQQNIIVEVPVINGEPPAMFHSSRNIEEFSLLESGKIYGDTPQTGQVYKRIEIKQCEQESSMQIEERIKRRREQNRFRMRALRASDSEVARRLRENNKFRMRMLRASGSQVAERIRERNKYRMRELRSGESQLIEKCANTSINVGEYLRKDQFKLNFCSEGRENTSILELDSLKGEFTTDINLRPETINLTCTVKEEVQNEFLNTLYSEKSQKQNLNYKSANVMPNESVSNTEQQSCKSVCNSIDKACHCSSVIVDSSIPELLDNDGPDTREQSKIGEMQASVCDIQCGVLQSTTLDTSAHNNKLHCRRQCIVHVGRDQVLGNIVGKVEQYHKINIQNDILLKEKSFAHFTEEEDLEQQDKLIKGMSLNISETSLSVINDQRKHRRERGKLRMRLKRHSETEEEAQRRRERGRLRMRVLRASETEEQAVRRRELNRLRMRMKRNSPKQ